MRQAAHELSAKTENTSVTVVAASVIDVASQDAAAARAPMSMKGIATMEGSRTGGLHRDASVVMASLQEVARLPGTTVDTQMITVEAVDTRPIELDDRNTKPAHLGFTKRTHHPMLSPDRSCLRETVAKKLKTLNCSLRLKDLQI